MRYTPPTQDAWAQAIFLTSALFCAFFISPFTLLYAEEACGNIIEIEDFVEYAEPIEDCSNPFNSDIESIYPVSVSLNGVNLETSGSVLTLVSDTSYDFIVTADTSPFRQFIALYQHVDAGYLLRGNRSSYSFSPGTYTLVVVSEERPILSSRSWWSKLRNIFIPTANAYFPDYQDVQTFTFTVEALSVSCGDIIYADGRVDAIEDCDNPFGVDATGSLENKTIAGQTLSQNGVITISSLTTSDYILAATAVSDEIIFKNIDGSYIEQTALTGLAVPILDPGAYVVIERLLIPGAPVLTSVTAALFFEVVAVPPSDGQFSSILFLPGIQASRLYTKESDGSEKLLWEPDFLFDDNDILRLAMDEFGQSVEDVFVRDVIDYAPQERVAENGVYGGFLQYLQTLKFNQIVNETVSFAYDWRYDVRDIVQDGVQYENEHRYVLEIIESLAADSFTGKVTIVAHSNGGLLGKAILDELAAQDKVDLVDTFIMLGTPQLGTPKAIGSLLHGVDQGFTFDLFGTVPLTIISDAAVREAARNMPGVYGLLPGQTYYDVADDTIVSFDSGTSTQVWRDSYGGTLNSQAALDDFLVSTDNFREAVPFDNVEMAIVGNPSLLHKARATRVLQDSWQPPVGIDTYAVVGTGRNTISGFEYVSFSERKCSFFIVGFGCEVEDLYKPVPIISQRGDQTVMTASAIGVSNDTGRLFVDLKLAEQATGRVISHANLTESFTVQTLVTSLLKATSTTLDFVSESEPSYGDQQLLLGVHSPVYVYIEDSAGRKTGQLSADEVVQEIPDTEWFALAGSSYIITPADLTFTVHIQSYAEGGMTFTSHRITSAGQTLESKVPVSVITASTTIALVYENKSFSNLLVDLDGDDVPDQEIQTDGTVIELLESPEQSTSTATSGGNATRVVRPTPQVAGISSSTFTVSTLTPAQIRELLQRIIERLINLKVNT